MWFMHVHSSYKKRFKYVDNSTIWRLSQSEDKVTFKIMENVVRVVFI